MKTTHRFWLVGMVFLLSNIPLPASGQTALEQLERRLFGNSLPESQLQQQDQPPAKPAPGAAVYLGFRGETSAAGGVDILAVDAVGPAKAAGLESGDRIVRFDGVDIADLDALVRVVSRMKPGRMVAVRTLRGNAQMTSTLTIGAAPDAPPAPRPSLGVSVTPVTDSARRTYGLPVRRGALVTAVTRGGAAAKASIRVGSVIVAVDGRQITKPEELIALVRASQAGRTMQLTLYESNRLVSRRVTLEAASATPEGSAGGGASENRFGESGRRPVLGALGRLLDDVIRDGADGGIAPGGGVGPALPPSDRPPATVNDPPDEPPTVRPAAPDPLRLRDEQLQVLIEELRALRMTVELLQRRVERLEAARGENAPPEKTKPKDDRAVEDLPEPKVPE